MNNLAFQMLEVIIRYAYLNYHNDYHPAISSESLANVLDIDEHLLDESPYTESIHALTEQNWITVDDDRYRLTPQAIQMFSISYNAGMAKAYKDIEEAANEHYWKHRNNINFGLE